VPLERDFETASRGEAVVGTSIESQVERLPADAQAEFEIFETPAGRGDETVTAKKREIEVPPPAIEPRFSWQVDPEVGSGVQVHPGELSAALKVV
jgi:hypothetical protein